MGEKNVIDHLEQNKYNLTGTLLNLFGAKMASHIIDFLILAINFSAPKMRGVTCSQTLDDMPVCQYRVVLRKSVR